jgi:hypothetical protein
VLLPLLIGVLLGVAGASRSSGPGLVGLSRRRQGTAKAAAPAMRDGCLEVHGGLHKDERLAGQ